LDYYHYNDITMLYIEEDDRKYLACTHDSFVTGICPVQPIAKSTRSRVAEVNNTLNCGRLSLNCVTYRQRPAQRENSAMRM
jgi:hypothetical protein